MLLAAVVQLCPVPVHRLVELDQYFRCEPYAATIRAATCLARQRLHGKKRAISAWGVANPDRTAPHAFRYGYYGTCAKCELGRRVKARLAQEASGD